MPRRKAPEAALLDLLAAKAPGLRKAGVLSVTLGAIQFTLMPPDPPEFKPPKGAAAGGEPADPFDGLPGGYGPVTAED